VFGELKVDVIVEGTFRSCTKPIYIIPSNEFSVAGIASLGDELFVIRYSSSNIDVYESATFTLKRDIVVSGLSNTNTPRGLVACSVNNCLYVSDERNNCIHRVDVMGNVAAIQWSVGAQPYGLSLNSVRNVLVACYNANTIREYSTQGTLVKQISLQSNITNPTHVIQLNNAQYGVIHQGTYHRYCVVDVNGQLVKSYGNIPGSADGQLYSPFGLTVDRQGYVFIAGQNNKIVVLDPAELTAKQLSIEGGFNFPYCIHIDKTHGRMYIGEWSGARIFVIGRREANTTAAETV
jgi:sugar lactone lactonase YvrE